MSIPNQLCCGGIIITTLQPWVTKHIYYYTEQSWLMYNSPKKFGGFQVKNSPSQI